MKMYALYFICCLLLVGEDVPEVTTAPTTVPTTTPSLDPMTTANSGPPETITGRPSELSTDQPTEGEENIVSVDKTPTQLTSNNEFESTTSSGFNIDESDLERDDVPELGVGSIIGIAVAALTALTFFVALMVIGAALHHKKKRDARMSTTKALSTGNY